MLGRPDGEQKEMKEDGTEVGGDHHLNAHPLLRISPVQAYK